MLICATACQSQKTSTDNNQISNITAVNSANSMTKTSEAIVSNTINFDAPDGVKIVGTFYGTSAADSPAVLMLHQFGANRGTYKDLARQFQSDGIAVLTIDGRGFGESTKKIDGSKVAVSQSNEAVAGMKSDVAAAVKFLSEQKNIDKSRIGIIGASYGSSLAIIYATENAEIKSVALLSPGTNYFGNLPTIPAIEKYGTRPVLIVAAEDDEESAEASRQLDKLAAGDKNQLQIYKKGGHGTGIFAANVGLEKLLLEFFQKNL
jgi:dienelactone hydrolase